MKCFVTGGKGFIGSHVIDLLKERGHETFCYDSQEGQDVRDFRMLETMANSFGADVIFHFAGLLGTSELMDNVREAEEINVIGTINMLEVCKKFGIPLVFASKLNPLDWINVYSITKQTCENYCEMYRQMWAVKECVMKLLNVYGPRQKAHPIQKFVPTFIENALNGKSISIYGTGNQLIDLVYVEDAAEACIRAWERRCWHYNPIEVGQGKGVKVIDIAKMVLELTNSTSKIKYIPMRSGEPLIQKHRVVAYTHKMHHLLGLDPKSMVQLEDGLKRTIAWWRSNE